MNQMSKTQIIIWMTLISTSEIDEKDSNDHVNDVDIHLQIR